MQAVNGEMGKELYDPLLKPRKWRRMERKGVIQSGDGVYMAPVNSERTKEMTAVRVYFAGRMRQPYIDMDNARREKERRRITAARIKSQMKP